MRGKTQISHGQLRPNSFFLFRYNFCGFLSSGDFIFLSRQGMLLIRCGVAEIVFAQLLI